MSGIGCHHRLFTTYMVRRDHACYAIIAIGKHKRSDDVGRYMPSFPWTTLTVGRLECGMALSHLDIIYGRTMSAHTVRQHCAWHTIIALGQHTRLDDVGRWMPIFLGQHRGSEYAARGMPLSIMVIIFELI
uniref:Uncharacterized protein n=1 Tax=Solanum lycopersicum TaxID=4081 RepID=A0A494G8S3_SOLLC